MPPTPLDDALRLALQHHQAGNLPQAESAYSQILAQHPHHPRALHFLALIALQRGHYEQSLPLFQSAIAHQPHFPEAYSNQATALRALKRLDQAAAACHHAIAQHPSFSTAHHNLGLILHDQQQLLPALSSFDRALALNPQKPDTHNHRGIILMQLNRFGEAVAAFQNAHLLAPTRADILSNLSYALTRNRQPADAIAIARQAIALDPSQASTYNNLGLALNAASLFDDALAAFSQALRLEPHAADTLYNLANTQRDYGRLALAESSYRQVLAQNPDHAPTLHNLAILLKDVGRLDESLATFRHLLRVHPQNDALRSSYLYCLSFDPACSEQMLAAESARCNELHALPLHTAILPHQNNRSPHRPLRIGYVSPDFRLHSVAFFIEPLLAAHDPAQVETFCYANLPGADAFTARMRLSAHHWRDIIDLADPDFADLVRRDQIDILVDLAGHTAGHRLLSFARKPAPLQISYLGYVARTGLSTIDYRFTDDFLDPPGADLPSTSEELIRLPQTFACYRPPESAPPISPLPAHTSADNHITFGNFSVLSKLSPSLLESWSLLLQQLPTARLLCTAAPFAEPACQQHFRDFFQRRGIHPSRLDLLPQQTFENYLALHQQIDILLDTFPVNGHTTTCHALWMGLPVITLAGNSYRARLGASVLNNLDLPEFVTDTPANYLRAATDLATDLPRLAELRSALRHRMQSSPLMNAKAFAKNVESAYRRLWQRWCEKSPPTP